MTADRAYALLRPAAVGLAAAVAATAPMMRPSPVNQTGHAKVVRR